MPRSGSSVQTDDPGVALPVFGKAWSANTDWWYKNPGVETLNFHAIADPATQFAAGSTGEIDLASVISADLLDAVVADPNVELVPTTAVPFWIDSWV